MMLRRPFLLALCSCASLSLLGLAHPLPAAELKTVRDFGAVGDGQADDSAAIQRAVDSGQGSVLFPKGTYRLGQTVTIKLNESGFTSLSGDGTARIVMSQAGPAFRLLGTHQGSADPTHMTDEVTHRQRMPMIRGVEIRGEHAEADGIEADGVVQLTLTELRVQQVRHAVRLARRNRNVIISNCHFYENSGCGILFDQVNLHQFNLTGSHISYNRGGGVVLRGGEVRNVHIGTCDIESNMGPDTAPTANILIDCTGGSVGEVAITGCTIQHNSKSPGSANIRYLGQGITTGKNTTPTQEGHLTITGNVFSDVMVNIHLSHVRGATITGNTFWEGFEQDLLIEHSQVIVVGANDFDRNPRYVVNGTRGKERNGILFRDCQDSKLSGVIVKGAQQEAAVTLERCDRFTVHDCSILDNDGIGLRLKDCTRSLVTNCLIRDDRKERKTPGPVSLEVTGGKSNVVRGNILSHGSKLSPTSMMNSSSAQ